MAGETKAVLEQLNRAVGCHQSGDLEGAARLYRAVLAAAPAQFDALHYLGLLEAQRGNAREGVQWLRRAVGIKPDAEAAQLNLANMLLELGLMEEALASASRAVELNARSPAALNSQGVILLELNRAQQALSALERALAIEPDYVDALSNRGNALLQLGRAAEALASYERALEIDPQSEQVLNNRGNALLELKRYAEAVKSFNRALQLRPDYAEALHHRGTAYWELHDTTAALADIERALQLNPQYPEALNSRGNVLVKLGRVEEGLASYERALTLWPEFVEALSNRGDALLKLHRDEAALASCERALALDPRHAGALNNSGNVWLQRGDARAALGLYERALELRPDYAVTLSNRGNALLALNRADDALDSYERALAIDPADAEANMNNALCRLLLGDFAQGWARYEWRWQNPPLVKTKRNFIQPLWLGGQPLKGKTILLHAEQGFGDTLQFCRYAEAVAAQGATVLLEVQPPLKALLATLNGGATLFSRGETLPAFDYQCPLLSLPLALGSTLVNLPAAVPYLRADPTRVEQWRAKLGEKKLPRIGLAWSGYIAPGRQHDRMLPLNDLLEAVSEQAQFFSLQKEIGESEKSALQRRQIRHCGDELQDFADTAALVALMDLVITIDTSVAHLAGALGKPVWILLRFNADWRWLRDCTDSPWYPTAKLFRQAVAGDWPGVVHELRRQLPLFLAGRHADFAKASTING